MVAARQYDAAKRYARRAIEIDPQGPAGYAILAASNEMHGRLPEALAAAQRAESLAGSAFSPVVARIYALRTAQGGVADDRGCDQAADPRFDGVRADPRFQEIAARMGSQNDPRPRTWTLTPDE
jgi:hypothetical protein